MVQSWSMQAVLTHASESTWVLCVSMLVELYAIAPHIVHAIQALVGKPEKRVGRSPH